MTSFHFVPYIQNNLPLWHLFTKIILSHLLYLHCKVAVHENRDTFNQMNYFCDAIVM